MRMVMMMNKMKDQVKLDLQCFPTYVENVLFFKIDFQRTWLKGSGIMCAIETTPWRESWSDARPCYHYFRHLYAKWHKFTIIVISGSCKTSKDVKLFAKPQKLNRHHTFRQLYAEPNWYKLHWWIHWRIWQSPWQGRYRIFHHWFGTSYIHYCILEN